MLSAYVLLVLATLFSGFQVHRFLWNERLSSLKLSANVSDADLRIDGQSYGALNKQITTISGLPPGKHMIRATGNKSYGVAEYSIILPAGSSINLHMDLPDRLAASQLRALSEPRGASIYLDDQLMGQTPLSNIQIDPGLHSIRIEKEGYYPISENRRFLAGQNYSIHFQLPVQKSDTN